MIKEYVYTITVFFLAILFPIFAFQLGITILINFFLLNILLFFMINKKPNLKIWSKINNPFRKDNKDIVGCLMLFSISFFVSLIIITYYLLITLGYMFR